MERPECGWCEQRISLSRLFHDRSFCCDEHRAKHEQLAVARLLGNLPLMAKFEAERRRITGKDAPALAPARELA
jgi:hypothetical protein